MPLRTRLDSRSQSNNKITVVEESTKEVLITIETTTENVALEITTKEGLYIEKPSGWKSRKAKKEEESEQKQELNK